MILERRPEVSLVGRHLPTFGQLAEMMAALQALTGEVAICALAGIEAGWMPREPHEMPGLLGLARDAEFFHS